MGNSASNEGSVDQYNALSYSTHFSKGQIKRLHKKFKQLAAQSPGDPDVITKEQFEEALSGANIEVESRKDVLYRLFELFDKDGLGLDFKEFCLGLSICTKGTIRERIRFAFTIYDIDGSGTISKDELVEAIHGLGKAFQYCIVKETENSNIKKIQNINNNNDDNNNDDLANKKEGNDYVHNDIVRVKKKSYLIPRKSVPSPSIQRHDSFDNFNFKVDDIKAFVDKAFEESDRNHDDEIDQNEFVDLVSSHPILVNILSLQHKTNFKDFNYILFVDESEHSGRAFEHVVSMVKPIDKIILCHIFPKFSLSGKPPFQKKEAYVYEYEQQKERMKTLLRYYKQRCQEQELEAEIEFKIGDPKSISLALIEEKSVDTVVVAARGLGSMEKAILGSFSEHILHHSNIPVLIIK